jgi:beta-1,4-N-acetylglucosaminyltransferase
LRGKLKTKERRERGGAANIEWGTGTGTVLDAMRVDIPIIVVPNEQLKDNHQVELAQELREQGWAVYGKLEYVPFSRLP